VYVGRELTTPPCNKSLYYEMLHRTMDVYRFDGIIQTMENGHKVRKLRSFSRSGSLKTVTRVLVKYELHLLES
jgi:hypothetical protein